jgi:hypothetical protein
MSATLRQIIWFLNPDSSPALYMLFIELIILIYIVFAKPYIVVFENRKW